MSATVFEIAQGNCGAHLYSSSSIYILVDLEHLSVVKST